MKKTCKQFFLITLIFFCLPAAAQELPPGLLGGMLKSDKWVIRRDKQQEEFTGNVSYDSPLYKLKARHALSDRAKNVFYLNGEVYLFNKTVNGETVELFADNAKYFTSQKTANANGGKTPLHLIYDAPSLYKIEADAKKLDLNFKTQTANLAQAVKIKYETEDDFTLAFADKAVIDRAANTALLEGNVEIDNKDYSIFAEKIFYNQNENMVEISGNYPLVTAQNEDASIAMQSDKITIDTFTKKARAQGRVSGWVSPK